MREKNVLSIDIGIRYLAYCLMGPETKEVKAFGILDIGEEGVTHNRIDSGTVARLKRAFDGLLEKIEEPSIVIVENQPPIAKLMRVIQGMTEMYFVCREGVDRVVVFDGRKKIVGARTKGLSGRANYAQRKKAAVEETKGAGAKTSSKSKPRKTATKSRTKRKSSWGKKGSRSVTVFTPLKMSGKSVGGCEFPQGPALTLDDAMAREYTKYARQMYVVMAKFRNLDRCLILKHGPTYTGANLNRSEAEALADLRLKAKDIQHQYQQSCARKNFQFRWNTKTDFNRQALVDKDKNEFAQLEASYGVGAMDNKLAGVGSKFDPSGWACAAFSRASPFADMAYDEGFDGDYGDDYGADEGFYGDVY
ncbi:Ribonuclease H-like domain containing protein [Klebsormidium nitens]|uniref:Ribonuclease H-like domain containing protein n=1 Tax=Klebsormidium nitens TaxID=105231 RepID=A0A1Y1IKP9_KLENI|nr:Ribonuclease H-like domain containing protein [Klebsormidium nitens]|eukprot:GAQ89989.1 Ribonuclease H-like domain containing protein [Klebsormidium nitens]